MVYNLVVFMHDKISCLHFPCSRELAEQAEDYEDMMGKRMEIMQVSMKKQQSRKRRREETGETI